MTTPRRFPSGIECTSSGRDLIDPAGLIWVDSDGCLGVRGRGRSSSEWLARQGGGKKATV